MTSGREVAVHEAPGCCTLYQIGLTKRTSDQPRRPSSSGRFLLCLISGTKIEVSFVRIIEFPIWFSPVCSIGTNFYCKLVSSPVHHWLNKSRHSLRVSQRGTAYCSGRLSH